jgi:broad specificity phosphatase PhoE
VSLRTIRAALDHAAAVEDGNDVLFITHNLPIRVLIATARSKSLNEARRIRLKHGSLRSIWLTHTVLSRWHAVVDGG